MSILSQKHLTSLSELRPEDLSNILEITQRLKQGWKKGRRPQKLAGHILTQVFEKPSLRTRTSFEAAMIQLGGGSMFLSGKEAGLNGRETLADIARVLGGYSDIIVLRTFSQSLIEEFARHSECPVINGLSDVRHPCQALTDFFTMQEVFGKLAGLKLVYVGDGNNVAKSLAIASAMLGVSMTVAAPKGFELKDDFLDEIKQNFPQSNIQCEEDPFQAVTHADVVYTDVWASMGQEKEVESRKKIFARYQVSAQLMNAAPAHSRFMHCLPAKRGVEVTDDVIDGPQSIAFLQAENRMHLAKGLLMWLGNASGSNGQGDLAAALD